MSPVRLPDRRPFRLLTAMGMVVGGFLLWSVWGALQDHDAARSRHGREDPLHDLYWTIVYSEEVLSTSAQMAAATGEPAWEEKYKLYGPRLEVSVQNARDLAPGAAPAASMVEKALDNRGRTEREVFQLVRRGRRGDARRLLMSPAYARERELYTRAMDEFLRLIKEEADGGADREARLALVDLAVLGGAAPFLLIGGVWVLWVVRRWERVEADAHQKLREHAEALASLNQTLDQKVLERTRSLAEEAEQRRAAEERLRRVIDTSPGLIFVKDWDGKFTLVNKTLADVYGTTVEVLLGKGDADFNPHKEEVAHFLKDDREVMTSGRRKTILEESVTDAKTGEVRWFQTIKVPLAGPDGHVGHVLGMATDITERRKIEAQYLRTQRIESIGTLAGGIAHDLNNVLGPILMSIPLLKRELKDDKLRAFLDMMEAGVRRGADMVRQVLAFSRGAKGERVLLNVESLAREMEKILKGTFPKSIGVKTSFQGPRPLLGDATQVHQVLLNLCVNARDAMPEGGTLSISAENVELGEDAALLHVEARPGRYVLVKVADTGEGIRPEILDKIFDPFFTTKAPGKGTGIGLSTVAGIVKGHGGFLSVYSEVGRGTQFALYFPAAEGAVAEEAPEAPLPAGRGELVLVVDDETSLREIMRATLQGYGYRVVTAADGAEAVSVFAQNEDVAAVILDMDMPVMDGPQTIRALVRMNPAVRIVASSGLKSGERPAPGEEGVQAFLPKPYAADVLLKTLERVLRKEAAAA